jgi:2,5-diketo-D-gluconate reductase A
MSTPLLSLNNGVEIPALGFGVFQTPPDETIAAVEAALAVGYRHIDTAAAYGNEREVGEALRRFLGSSGLDRSEVFVETKVWISDYGYDETLHAFDRSAGKLGVDQIDLFILHQALPGEFALSIDAYRALEKLLADGKVRAIEVSNFMPDHLAALLDATSVVPAVNQIEVHPYFRQSDLLAVDDEHGILSQAWSPIGGITFYRDRSLGSTMEDATIKQIAATHGKTPAQVMLRWHLQQGRQAIPKSVTPSRIAENFDVFDFELTTEQLDAIDALDTGVRGGPEPDVSRVSPSAGRSLRREERTRETSCSTPGSPGSSCARRQFCSTGFSRWRLNRSSGEIQPCSLPRAFTDPGRVAHRQVHEGEPRNAARAGVSDNSPTQGVKTTGPRPRSGCDARNGPSVANDARVLPAHVHWGAFLQPIYSAVAGSTTVPAQRRRTMATEGR